METVIQQKIINDYKDGMTWDSLCQKYSTDLHTLHKVFKRN